MSSWHAITNGSCRITDAERFAGNATLAFQSGHLVPHRNSGSALSLKLVAVRCRTQHHLALKHRPALSECHVAAMH